MIYSQLCDENHSFTVQVGSPFTQAVVLVINSRFLQFYNYKFQNDGSELAEKDFLNLTISQNVNKINQEEAVQILHETAGALEIHW